MNVWDAFIEVRGFCRNLTSETQFPDSACLWAIVLSWKKRDYLFLTANYL